MENEKILMAIIVTTLFIYTHLVVKYYLRLRYTLYKKGIDIRSLGE